MRKPVLFALIAVVVVLAVVAAVLFARYQKISTEYTNMRLAEETARVGYSEAFNAITEIQDSLNAIAVGDTTVQMLSAGAKSEMKVTEAVRRWGSGVERRRCHRGTTAGGSCPATTRAIWSRYQTTRGFCGASCRARLAACEDARRAAGSTA